MKPQFRPNPIGKCLSLKDFQWTHSAMNGGQAAS